MAPTVLIVDDHPTFRRFARQLLEEAGYAVVGEAADGASAIDAVRKLEPEIVLLDILLPDVSGLAVADELAAFSPAPEVVLVSSRSTADFGATLERAPIRRFVSKHELTVAALPALLGEQ
jgi:two-component system, NarL family, nitrate/nitrite response regulator NarL